MEKKKYNLEDRLVSFAGEMILFLGSLPQNQVGGNFYSQLNRSVTSAALNFGESQGAESPRDQIHKLSISLKELKESRVALKILAYIKYGDNQKYPALLQECNELIAIIATIIKNKRIQNH
jgi:four helix bundle protein